MTKREAMEQGLEAVIDVYWDECHAKSNDKQQDIYDACQRIMRKKDQCGLFISSKILRETNIDLSGRLGSERKQRLDLAMTLQRHLLEKERKDRLRAESKEGNLVTRWFKGLIKALRK